MIVRLVRTGPRKNNSLSRGGDLLFGGFGDGRLASSFHRGRGLGSPCVVSSARSASSIPNGGDCVRVRGFGGRPERGRSGRICRITREGILRTGVVARNARDFKLSGRRDDLGVGPWHRRTGRRQIDVRSGNSERRGRGGQWFTRRQSIRRGTRNRANRSRILRARVRSRGTGGGGRFARSSL